MKLLSLFLLFAALALPAVAQQRIVRTVPTVADMLALDPKNLATATVGTNANFLVVVVTTGDTVAGDGARTWFWDGASSVATNTVPNHGPLARPYGASTGRYLKLPTKEDVRIEGLVGAVGSGTNLTSITVDNVAAMLALPHSRLTNGPVLISTVSRVSGGIGGAQYRFDVASVAVTNLGAILAHGSGGRFICVSAEPCNVEIFGADPLGATDSAAAVQSALNYAATIKRRAYLPGKTYYWGQVAIPDGVVCYGEPGLVIRAFEYPAYPGGSTSAQTDLVKASISMGNDTTLDMNDCVLDERFGDFTATSFKFAGIGFRGASNVRIMGLRILNAWDFSIAGRYSTNITLTEVVVEGGPSKMEFSKCVGLSSRYCMSLNQSFTRPGSGQHMVDLMGNVNESFFEFTARNTLATSAGSSYAVSGFTVSGCKGSLFDRMHFEPLNAATDVNSAGILLDGCMNATLQNSDIQWNVAASTAVEVSSPRSVIVQNNIITGPKNYTSNRTVGGAGIYVVDMGIWSEDFENWQWNEAGWQFRGRSAGANLIIKGNTISRQYNGILLGSSYSQVIGNTLVGNISNGITIGRTGTSGASEYGWASAITHRTVGNEIAGNLIAWNGDNGINAEKFDDLNIHDNTVTWNNQNNQGFAGLKTTGTTDQGSIDLRDNFFGQTPTWTLTGGFSLDPTQPQYVSRSARVTGSGSVSNQIVSATSMTANSYSRLYLRVSTTGETARILNRNQYLVNTVSTYAIGTTSIALDTGSGAIVAGDVLTFAGDTNGYVVATDLTAGTVVIQSPGLLQTLADNVAVTHTTKLIPLEASLTSTPGSGVAFDVIEVPFYKVSVAKGEEIMPGQRIRLSGVQTGGVNLDVMVSHFDWVYPDEFWVNPVGSANSFNSIFTLAGWQQTVAGAVTTGTGTLSYTYRGTNYYNPQLALMVTSTVTAATELDGPWWIGVDPGTGTYEWRAVRRSAGYGGVATQFYVNAPFSQSFSGKTFRIFRADGLFGTGQSWGVDMPSSTAKLNIIGTGNCFGGNLNSAGIRGVSALDVPYPRLPDSASPTIPIRGDKFQTALTTARTITSMSGGWEGRQIQIFYLSGSVPTFDCTASSIASQDGTDKVLTVGSVVTATYSNGKWSATFMIP